MVTQREERANNVHTINVVFGVRRCGEPLRLRRGGSFNHIVLFFSEQFKGRAAFTSSDCKDEIKCLVCAKESEFLIPAR